VSANFEGGEARLALSRDVTVRSEDDIPSAVNRLVAGKFAVLVKQTTDTTIIVLL